MNFTGYKINDWPSSGHLAKKLLGTMLFLCMLCRLKYKLQYVSFVTQDLQKPCLKRLSLIMKSLNKILNTG